MPALRQWHHRPSRGSREAHRPARSQPERKDGSWSRALRAPAPPSRFPCPPSIFESRTPL
eukprot:308827-Prymnesium_polylepis.1